MMQSSQGGDPSPEPCLGDSQRIGPEMQEKVLGSRGDPSPEPWLGDTKFGSRNSNSNASEI